MVHAQVVSLSRAMAHQDRKIGSYRPKGKVMPKEAVKHLIALLTGRLNVGYPGAPPDARRQYTKTFGASPSACSDSADSGNAVTAQTIAAASPLMSRQLIARQSAPMMSV